MKVTPKKSLGQNFLMDYKVVEYLISAAEVGPEDVVVEVGAGTGIVTKELAKRAGRVVAVEFDHDLIPILKEELKEFKNVEIVNQDILDFDFYTSCHPELDSGSKASEMPKQVRHDENPHFKAVGSIPYQITSPLIHKLLTNKPRPSLIVFLIQLEVAEKICARPPRATYLSNFVEAFGEAAIIRKVSPAAFRPQPKVNSAILKINLIQPLGLDSESEAKRLSSFLHRGFKSPRKMLNKAFPKELLERAGIDATRRPQTLSFSEWVNLYYRIENGKI